MSISLVKIKLSVVDFVSEFDKVSSSSLDPRRLWDGLDERDIDFIQVLRIYNWDHIRWFDERETERWLHHLRVRATFTNE